jgi:hypothetical protein
MLSIHKIKQPIQQLLLAMNTNTAGDTSSVNTDYLRFPSSTTTYANNDINAAKYLHDFSKDIHRNDRKFDLEIIYNQFHDHLLLQQAV